MEIAREIVNGAALWDNTSIGVTFIVRDTVAERIAAAIEKDRAERAAELRALCQAAFDVWNQSEPTGRVFPGTSVSLDEVPHREILALGTAADKLWESLPTPPRAEP